MPNYKPKCPMSRGPMGVENPGKPGKLTWLPFLFGKFKTTFDSPRRLMDLAS